MNGLPLREVVDLVGQVFDEAWIDGPTAVELICEHGHVSREKALVMLVTADPDAEVEADRRDDGTWC